MSAPPPGLPNEVGYWKDVEEWCLGENDRYGTCPWVGIANFHVAVTTQLGDAQVMTDGEIEFADSQMTGFNPFQPMTDRGDYLPDVLRWWEKNGWPGDPTLRPTGWREVDEIEMPAAIHHACGLYVWAMLPKIGDEDYDFTNGALSRGIPGSAAHCMYMAGYSASIDSFHLVSWAEVYTVSRPWWQIYGKQAFVVGHPMWTPPPGSTFKI